jgi:sugar lactone lactonase YvrE
VSKPWWVALAAVAAVGGYLAAWPVPIDPQVWQPSPDPGFTGVYAENDALEKTERLFASEIHGADALALDRRGHLVSALADGRIVRIEPGREVKTLGISGGRPLGIVQSPVGVYLLADALHGLVGAKGRRHFSLVEEVGGEPLQHASDVALTHARQVFFLEASSKFGFHDSYDEFLEHGAHGRLLRYDDMTNATGVVLDGLHFPGGLAESAEGDALLIADTAEYRVLRHWLSGEKAGRTEPFIDGLPGFPAHLSWNGRDTYWLALYSPRVAAFDRWAARPWLRKLVRRLPAFLQPHPETRAIVLGLDRNGHVVHNLQYAGADAFAPVTSVLEQDGWLYLGSLTAQGIARVRAPGAGPAPAVAPRQATPEKEEDD